jgi:hypothetical protein
MAQISATSMRLVDLLHFVAEHEEHHLAQIWGRCKQNLSGTAFNFGENELPTPPP